MIFTNHFTIGKVSSLDIKAEVTNLLPYVSVLSAYKYFPVTFNLSGVLFTVRQLENFTTLFIRAKKTLDKNINFFLHI